MKAIILLYSRNGELLNFFSFHSTRAGDDFEKLASIDADKVLDADEAAAYAEVRIVGSTEHTAITKRICERCNGFVEKNSESESVCKSCVAAEENK